MSETNGSGRREWIVELLREAHRAITGSQLSMSLGVSRPAIVNDMAILRAAGEPIGGSPQGYHWDGDRTSGVFAVLTCAHDREGSQKELETLVAYGITVHHVGHRVRAPDDVALASARGDLELLGFLHEG
jgi:uncharacterized protein